MRGLMSTTTMTTTTVKGKRKLAQTKELQDSPPVIANGREGTTRGKMTMSEVQSPPAKRRRSSDRIANKMAQKRESIEDDDGFVFTRAPKPKKAKTATSTATAAPVTAKVASAAPRAAKRFVIDFTADVHSLTRAN